MAVIGLAGVYDSRQSLGREALGGKPPRNSGPLAARPMATGAFFGGTTRTTSALWRVTDLPPVSRHDGLSRKARS